MLRMLRLYYYYYDYVHYINLYRLQGEHHSINDTTQAMEEEQAEGALRKRRNLLFLNPAFLSYFSNAVVVVKRLS